MLRYEKVIAADPANHSLCVPLDLLVRSELLPSPHRVGETGPPRLLFFRSRIARHDITADTPRRSAGVVHEVPEPVRKRVYRRIIVNDCHIGLLMHLLLCNTNRPRRCAIFPQLQGKRDLTTDKHGCTQIRENEISDFTAFSDRQSSHADGRFPNSKFIIHNQKFIFPIRVHLCQSVVRSFPVLPDTGIAQLNKC